MTNDDKFSVLMALVAEFDPDGEVERGTMMGFACLRRSGNFFACLDREGTSLIVKLPAARVNELVERGHGLAFAPAGRVFREWVEIPPARAGTWPSLVGEALAFAAA